jgi:hypothetical protein
VQAFETFLLRPKSFDSGLQVLCYHQIISVSKVLWWSLLNFGLYRRVCMCLCGLDLLITMTECDRGQV